MSVSATSPEIHYRHDQGDGELVYILPVMRPERPPDEYGTERQHDRHQALATWPIARSPLPAANLACARFARVLDHHDGIVHHDADSEHQGKERSRLISKRAS